MICQASNATARVILGLQQFSPRTGYDVKRVTDFSTRFFWRASYWQIYPEQRSDSSRLLAVRGAKAVSPTARLRADSMANARYVTGCSRRAMYTSSGTKGFSGSFRGAAGW